MIRQLKVSKRDADIYRIRAAFEEPGIARWRIEEASDYLQLDPIAKAKPFSVEHRGWRDGRFRFDRSFPTLEEAVAYVRSCAGEGKS